MSLDNVLAVAATAREHPAVLFIGLALSVTLMGLAANLVAKLVQRFRWIAWIGLLLILYVALKMIWDGAHQFAADALFALAQGISRVEPVVARDSSARWASAASASGKRAPIRTGTAPEPIISNSRAAEACSSSARRRIIAKRRPGQEQRAAARQLERAERRHRPRGIAVAHHQPAPAEARQRRRPARRADAVEHGAARRRRR